MITRIWFVLLGAVAIMTFALTVLVAVPEQLLDQVTAPPGLAPYTQAEQRGRYVYLREGCVYCHTQQVRTAEYAVDEARGWGRPTVPSDYVFDEPHFLGTMRTGPDLTNVGARLPDRQWHLLHLYQPRALVDWSIMPSFRYLFFEVDEYDLVYAEVVELPEGMRVPGKKLIARRDASYLVDYLLSLDRTYLAVQGPPEGGEQKEAADAR